MNQLSGDIPKRLRLNLTPCFHQKPGFLNKTVLSLVEHFRQTYELTNESTVLFKSPGFLMKTPVLGLNRALIGFRQTYEWTNDSAVLFKSLGF